MTDGLGNTIGDAGSTNAGHGSPQATVPPMGNSPATVRPFHKLKGNLDLDAILDRIANGETVAAIAKEHGATPAGLLWHLQKIPDYQVARELGMETRLDLGLAKIERAVDSEDLNLARVAEIGLRRLEWRAQVEFQRWAPKNHQTIEHVGDLGDRLRQARERVIDSTSQRVDVMSTTPEQPEPTNGGVQITGDAGSTDGRGTL